MIASTGTQNRLYLRTGPSCPVYTTGMNTTIAPIASGVLSVNRQASIAILVAAALAASVAATPHASAQEPAAATPTKNLIVPGEVFDVDGHTAFLFTPAEVNALPPGAPRPWILYGPTLAAYPDEAEKWMHERFT